MADSEDGVHITSGHNSVVAEAVWECMGLLDPARGNRVDKCAPAPASPSRPLPMRRRRRTTSYCPGSGGGLASASDKRHLKRARQRFARLTTRGLLPAGAAPPALGTCYQCEKGNQGSDLMLCDGPGCAFARHWQCGADLLGVPEGKWFCKFCIAEGKHT